MQFRKSLFLLTVFDLLLPVFICAAYPAEVSRTGQTISSAAGDDGDIQAGVPWPDPRLSKSADGTVFDNLTGLVWAKNANLLGTDDADNDTGETVGDGAVSWQHALDYIKKLNRESYLGQSDWRLPNVHELESLVHAGVYDPALPPNPFTNVQADSYWSST
ncbi:MAG: DUF1566 domain-containing protein, partial [Proteobacteria bacterium]|nr:DUF1566 domain-containing protein [Pseudomonadota bacterium]